MLRSLLLITLLAMAASASSGCNDDTEAKDSKDSTAQSPYMGAISGQLQAKPGAPSTSVAGANVFLEGHPEVSTTTDSKGNFELNNAPAGTHNVFAVSSNISLGGGRVRPNKRSGLSVSGTGYGLKITDVAVSTGSETALGKKELKETGAIQGNVTFYTNPNNLDLTGSEVYIPGTSFIAKTDAFGAFSLTGIPEGEYTLRFEHTGFSVTQLEAVSVAEGQVTDLGDVPLSLSTGPEGAITITPDLTPTIGSDEVKVSTSRTVNVTLSYDADAALMKISDESSFLNKPWVPVASTSTWTFTSDGEKTLYVKYSDLNGLESSPYSVSFIVDTEAPKVTSLKLVYGWSSVASTAAFGDIAASDTGTGVAEVYFAGAGFGGASGWVAYDPQLPITLSSGVGAKTVTVKVRDYAGNESVGTVQDGINLSTKTTIYNGTYDSKVTLVSALSPYWVPDGVTFDGDLEIEAGTTIEIANLKSIEVKGVVTAQGTAVDPIVIKRPTSGSDTCSVTAAPTLIFNAGAPGVSEQSVFQYVSFQEMAEIHLNGGTFSHVEFDNSTCQGGAVGIVDKSGEDNLLIDHSTYSAYSTAIDVKDGVGNTTFTNNSGSATLFFKQSGSATASVVSGNTFSLGTGSSAKAFVVSSGTLDAGSTNDLSGGGFMTNSLIDVSGDGSLTVSGLNLNGGAKGINAQGNAVVSVSNSTIAAMGGVSSLVDASSSASVTLNGVTASGWSTIVTSQGNATVNVVDSTFGSVAGTAIVSTSAAANAIGISGSSFTYGGGAGANFTQLQVTNSSLLTISDTLVTGFTKGIVLLGGGSIGVSLDHVDITLDGTFLDSQQTSSLTASVTNSNVTITNASNLIDLFYNDMTSGDADSITFTDNNISCIGTASTGCRGFTVMKAPMGSQTGTTTLALSGNYWGGGKTPIASIVSNKVVDSSVNSSTASDGTNVKLFHFSSTGAVDDIDETYTVTETHAGSSVVGAGLLP